MRLGRNGSPWEFVAVGLAAMRVMPDDDEVRFLLAGAYARVGLKTAAMEQLGRLSAAVRGDAGVRAMVSAVEAMADDRVEVDALRPVLVANVEALRGKAEGAVDVRGEIRAWEERAARREHFRTSAGDVVWRTIGDAGGWERFGNQAEQAGAVRLPHDERPTAAACPPWYVVEGIDPPWMFKRVFASTSGRVDGFSPRVIVVQRSVAQFVDGLAQVDVTREIGDERVVCFVGETAGARLAEYLGGEAGRGARIASAAIGLPTTVERVAPSPQEVVSAASAGAERMAGEVRARVDAMYANRDRAWWGKRYAEATSGAGGGGGTLRVLIVTSRFSTFLRHSAADLAAGFEEAGSAARVLMEPDDHSLGEPLSRLLAVEEFGPDLVLVPNYLRRDLGESVPKGVPFATWIQDAMPHLYDAAAGRSVGEMDFVVGNLAEEMFQKFGYPRGRSLGVPMAASSGKFHAGPVEGRLAARHGCEIAYVSHHSETPEVMLARKVGEAGGSAGLSRAMGALFERVREEIERPIGDGPVLPRLRRAASEELARVGMPTDDRTVAAAMTTFAMPLADRALRHRTLEWAGEIARERGWRVHLYGRGWETHPTLGEFARGEIEHGEDLRACYQTARVHLHVSLHTAIHQRVFECAMSGGLPVCRLMADDLSHLEYLGAAHACRVAEPIACDAWRVAALGYRYFGYAAGACEASRGYAEFCERLGLGRPEILWLNQVHVERLCADERAVIDGDGRSIRDLWPDPAAVMFHDAASMRRVLVRAVEDAAWRDGASAGLRERARERVSYGALARRVISFVSQRLNSDGADARRWYDGEGTVRARSR